ncbi:MAG: transcription termination/antitermination factor NusG [bacterium]|nr:transcription termination/antitermination factor NusG [bacterium]
MTKTTKEDVIVGKTQSNRVIINDKVPADAGKWYVIHTYSGHEYKVANQIKQRAQTLELVDKIFEVIIPTQEKILIKQGKKHQINERVFPGYILVRMILDDNTWLAVRTTQGVTGFVGAGNQPIPLPEKEVKAIKKLMISETPKFKTKFSVGEAVKIIDGPFSDFLGTIESIDEEKGKVRVLVLFFGRETPVDLDFLQIQKI